MIRGEKSARVIAAERRTRVTAAKESARVIAAERMRQCPPYGGVRHMAVSDDLKVQREACERMRRLFAEERSAKLARMRRLLAEIMRARKSYAERVGVSRRDSARDGCGEKSALRSCKERRRRYPPTRWHSESVSTMRRCSPTKSASRVREGCGGVRSCGGVRRL